MTVSDRMREIESEIDAKICTLPVSQASRAEVIEQLMHTYRDISEVIFLKFLHAQTFDSPPENFGPSFVHENQIRGGVLWASKWALEYCPVSGTSGARSPEELESLISLGSTYLQRLPICP